MQLRCNAHGALPRRRAARSGSPGIFTRRESLTCVIHDLMRDFLCGTAGDGDDREEKEPVTLGGGFSLFYEVHTVEVDVTLDAGPFMSDDFELLTYKELAERMQIKLASARQTVSRRGWRRTRQNDKTVKIHVPTSYLQRETTATDEATDIKVDVDTYVEIATLSAENTFLKQRITDLETDRDAWKKMAQMSWWKRLF